MKNKENRIRFEAINIHKNSKNYDDHEKIPWVQTSRIEEKHGSPIYSCCFNQYISEGQTPILLTVCGRFVHVYDCPLSSNAINPIGSFQCTSETEMLFSSAWCYDTFEKETPYHFAVAGNNAIIYIVEATTQKLVNTLTSHGGPINEIRTNPNNSNIIASASKDKTVRVFHIRNRACIFVLAGHESHADQILSLDWSFCGKKLITCGMDHTIYLWNLGVEKLSNTLNIVNDRLSTGKRNCLEVSVDDFIVTARGETEKDHFVESKKKCEDDIDILDDVTKFGEDIEDDTRETVYMPVYFPSGQNADLHIDYVDCVRYFKNSEYIFSKGCGKESVIYMSRFGTMNKEQKITKNHLERSSIKMMTKIVPNGETWFIKFDVDPLSKWIACGNNIGDIHFWKLLNFEKTNPDFTINAGSLPIRQVVFGGYGRILIAVADDGSISRMDRISAHVANIPSFKILSNTQNGARNVKNTTSAYNSKQDSSSKAGKIKAYTDMSCDFSDDDE